MCACPTAPGSIKGPTRVGHVMIGSRSSARVFGRPHSPGLAASCKASPRGGVDLVLSSGFLSFANHAGFLAAMQEAGVPIAGVMGTSAGALTGALYCAGYTPEQVVEELTRDRPLALLRPCLQPWKGGVLSLHKVVERLEELLPPTFDQLQREFAVGVVRRDGVYRVLDKGRLAPAVVASAAIPILFANIDIDGTPGGPFKDGGGTDRIGLTGWRARRRNQGRGMATTVAPPPAVVHLIRRSSPFSGADDVQATGERRVTVVRSPKSGVSLWSLGDVGGQYEAARERAMPAAYAVMERQGAREPAGG